MEEHDLISLFNRVKTFEDTDVFANKVLGRLRFKYWFRQSLIAFAGLMGGIYALLQFIPMYATSNLSPVHESASANSVTSDQTLRLSGEFFTHLGEHMFEFFMNMEHYISLIQTPWFFWVSFSLCIIAIALYYANFQEELF